MNKLKLFAGVMLLAAVSFAPVRAGTITFEGMPNDYYFYGGQVNFGNYWAGVNFGPEATILDSALYGYNSGGYPAHSGTAVLFSISNSFIDMTLDTPVDDVSFWFTNGSGTFTVQAFDSSNNLLFTNSFGTNYGTNSFFDVFVSTGDISRIRWSGAGNYFTIDDVTVNTDLVTGNPRVPETASSLALLGLGMISIMGLRRKFARN